MSAISFPQNPNIGEIFTNPNTGSQFQWTGSAWSSYSAPLGISATGPAGSSGTSGFDGVTGPQGIQGEVGPVGPAGLNWRGMWAAATTYVEDDSVGYTGASWFNILGITGNASNIPPDQDTTHWALLASQGSQGQQGPQGLAGTNGTSGSSGSSGSSGLSGVNGTSGTSGAKGSTGSTGPVTVVYNFIVDEGNAPPVGQPAWLIDGQFNPTLTLYRGLSYTFQIVTTSRIFWIKTAKVSGTGSQYNNGVTNNGASTGTVTFTVPLDAPNTLYYVDQTLPGLLGGNISIQNLVSGTSGTSGSSGTSWLADGPAGVSWIWKDGTPTSSGGVLAGNAAFYTANPPEGVALTTNANAQNGSMYWTYPTANFFNTNNWIVRANIKANGGSGADGFYIFGGAIGNDQTGTLTAYFDEYNSDVVKVFLAGTLLDTFSPYQGVFDDNKFRSVELICQSSGSNKIVYVTMDGIVLYKRNIGTFTFPGNTCGIHAFTGGANNFHFVNRFQAGKASVWLASNGY